MIYNIKFLHSFFQILLFYDACCYFIFKIPNLGLGLKLDLPLFPNLKVHKVIFLVMTSF